MTDKLSSQMREITELYSEAGWAEVWRSWKDNMLAQGRKVRPELETLPIPSQDRALDIEIAKDIVVDFLVWVEVHHGLVLNTLAVKESVARMEKVTRMDYLPDTNNTAEDKCPECGGTSCLIQWHREAPPQEEDGIAT